jgi:UDP-N-acetylmuramoylalanine--D-glutamate ligase
MRDYMDSKMKIFTNQREEDFAVINACDKHIMDLKGKINAPLYYFSTDEAVTQGAYTDGNNIIFAENGTNEVICRSDVFSLPGDHNLQNCLAAVIPAKISGLKNSEIEKGLGSFQNVEHRLERIGKINGVEFINDSKSTNVACVEKALTANSAPIVLILGGLDKGNDYSQIEKIVKEKVEAVFAIGGSKEKIENAFKDIVPVFICDTLEKAVKGALNCADHSGKILFSPACASFDMFKDYKDRGRQFKEIFYKFKKEHE